MDRPFLRALAMLRIQNTFNTFAVLSFVSWRLFVIRGPVQFRFLLVSMLTEFRT